MIRFIEGNLLKSPAQALVNTVNEVGVMGKGIALMFKEAFPENNAAYERACKRGEVRVGHVFVFESTHQWGPRWIVNFPTKKHWRNPSKIEWVKEGLGELREWIHQNNVRSIAVPPLGCGNGGLRWPDVKSLIVEELSSLNDVDVEVYVPTATYQNSPKEASSKKLTPARAMILEMIRRYGVLGFECSMLEVQKLAWFLQRGLAMARLDNPLRLHFEAGKYGPYADTLRHLLDGLDGSYLHSPRRIADATRDVVITFKDERSDELDQYLGQSKLRKYHEALEWAEHVVRGFESPFGMELLATIDWLVTVASVPPRVDSLIEAINKWPFGSEAAKRKAALFDERVIRIALERLLESHSFRGKQQSLAMD